MPTRAALPIPIPAFAPVDKALLVAFACAVSDGSVFCVEGGVGADELLISARGVQ